MQYITGKQYGRSYQLTFYKPDVKDNSPNVITVSDLRMKFDVEFYVDNKEKTNKGKISLYNLSDETIKKISTRFGIIKLEVGYATNLSTLVEGDVINIKTSKEGVDKVTTFELAPNFINMAIKKLSRYWPENVTLKTVVDNVAADLGLGRANVKGSVWENIILPYGYPVFGTGKQVLDEIANAFDVEWKIIDNILYVTDKYALIDTKAELAIVLTQDTGLIDIPYTEDEEITNNINEALDVENEQYVYSSPKLKKDGTLRKSSKYKARRYGVKMKALINPSIKANSLIKLGTLSGLLDGFYRVRSVKFTGDTRGQEWYMDIWGSSVDGKELN